MGAHKETLHFFHAFVEGVDYVFVDNHMFLGKIPTKTEGRLYGPHANQGAAGSFRKKWGNPKVDPQMLPVGPPDFSGPQ